MSAIKPRTTSVVIYQGDDLEHLAELKRKADQAERLARSTAARAGDDRPAQAEKDAYDEFTVEAAERALVVELRAIGRKRFRNLMAQHPARMVASADGQSVHDEDEPFGVNVETFPEALLTFVDENVPDTRTISEPRFSSKSEALSFLDDDVADGDYEKLWVSAYQINRAMSADPKAMRYSVETPSSDAT